MPTFRTELPKDNGPKGLQLRRTPKEAALTGIVTCDNVVIVDTHYWHGRTTPCERQTNDAGRTIDDSACQPCREKQSWRTHCYVSTWSAKTQEHFLFECTAQAAVAFLEYRAANKTLRGCGFAATRPRGTTNGKVTIITKAVDLSRTPCPNAPDVHEALLVIWRIPLTAKQTEQTPDGRTIGHVNGKKTRSMREQADNAGLPPERALIQQELAAAAAKRK